jgi:hypothetical protein
MLLDRHHPELEWRTIIDDGNPQTLVWRRRRGITVSAVTDQEVALATQRAYVDVFANGVPEYFHAMSESLALSQCVASIRK